MRDKVLYNLVLFAIILMAASYLIGQLTAGQDVKIIKDLGLSATSLFGLFIAVFIGIGLVSKEVERRSVYSLLAKPIHRYQMVVGKCAGLVLTLFVNVAIMAAAAARGPGLHGMGRVSRCPAGMGCAGARSCDLEGGGTDPRRADGDHGHRALLLDVLNADTVRGFHHLDFLSSDTSAPTFETSNRLSTRRPPPSSLERYAGFCRTSLSSTSRHRSSTPSPSRLVTCW